MPSIPTATWRKPSEILDSLDPELGIELDEVEMVLHRVQQFEPLGIGARDLSECLLLQLKQLPAGTPWLEEAQRVARATSTCLAAATMPS